MCVCVCVPACMSVHKRMCTCAYMCVYAPTHLWSCMLNVLAGNLQLSKVQYMFAHVIASNVFSAVRTFPQIFNSIQHNRLIIDYNNRGAVSPNNDINFMLVITIKVAASVKCKPSSSFPFPMLLLFLSLSVSSSKLLWWPLELCVSKNITLTYVTLRIVTSNMYVGVHAYTTQYKMYVYSYTTTEICTYVRHITDLFGVNIHKHHTEVQYENIHTHASDMSKVHIACAFVHNHTHTQVCTYKPTTVTWDVQDTYIHNCCDHLHIILLTYSMYIHTYAYIHTYVCTYTYKYSTYCMCIHMWTTHACT